MIAFSVGHGKIHWRHTIGPSESSPLIVGDRLYVGDWNGDVWAFDANHGRVLWRKHVGGAIKGGLAYAADRLYVGSYDGHVYCLTTSGEIVWRASAQPRLFGHATFYSTPAVAYGRVYIGSTDGKVYSFGATTGKLRWSHGTGGYVYASPAVWRQTVYAGSYSRRFYALDAATGDVRWSFDANGPISGSATVIGGVVYFSTLKQRTYALDATHRPAAVVVPRRQVHARRRREEPAVPRRLRDHLCDGASVRYVVTGAAGFIGSHLAEALVQAGHDVVGIDCFTDYYDPAEKEENARGLDVRRLDLAADPLDLDGVDGVFHLAAQAGVRSFGDVFPLYLRRNVLATQRVFEAAAAAGVRVVFASSSSVYGEAEAYPTPESAEPRPISPYGVTKLACEHLARAYAAGFGLDAVVLRYFTVYGPRQRPDMFFRRVCDALLGGPALRDLRDRRAVAELHGGRRRGGGDDRGDGARAGRGRLQRRRRRRGVDARGDRRARAAVRAAARRPARRRGGGRRPAHEGGRLAHPRGPRLGASDAARGRLEPDVVVGLR